MDGDIKVIVGLGNPTGEYAGTRHNIGFDVITAISDRFLISVKEKKHKALIGKGMLGGQRVLLAKPQTYMNASGESVRAILDFYRLTPDNLLVVYDDISLDVGRIRIRKKGSAGGHNGMKSIIAHLGTTEFARIRVGIGEEKRNGDLVNHVLGHFSKSEEPIIRDAITDAQNACLMILEQGIEEAMNVFNKKKETDA